ncbi:hypothetical protein V8C40DRAFT_256639 [Trichoderma camerunense]
MTMLKRMQTQAPRAAARFFALSNDRSNQRHCRQPARVAAHWRHSIESNLMMGILSRRCRSHQGIALPKLAFRRCLAVMPYTDQPDSDGKYSVWIW